MSINISADLKTLTKHNIMNTNITSMDFKYFFDLKTEGKDFPIATAKIIISKMVKNSLSKTN